MDDLPCRNARVRLWAAGLLIMAAAGGCADSEVITGTDAEASAATGWDWSSSLTVPALNCTSQVNHLQTANCFVSPPPEEDPTFGVTNWQFVGIEDDRISIQRVSMDQSWDGPMVTSGYVKVDVTVNGQNQIMKDTITVVRRSWSWAESIGGQQGVPEEIDECVDERVGLTSGQSCTAGGQNLLFTPAVFGRYSLDVVSGSGPNGGVHYVANSPITMQIRTQVNRRWRMDGDTTGLPMEGDPAVVGACGDTLRNHHFVNTMCAPVAAYDSFLAYAWNHESLHMDAVLAAAKLPAGDVHELWEPLVSQTQSVVQGMVDDEKDLAHAYILNRGACSHTGQDATFFFWRNRGSGWASDSIPVDESLTTFCGG